MIVVEPARSLDDCLEIRRVVFVEEQHVPLAEDIDGLDPMCEQLLARVDGVLAGTARLRLTDGGRVAKGERLAVLAPYRRHGVGVALIQALEARARALGCHILMGAAQVHALGFYQTLGYVADGDDFLDAGIVHRHITKVL